jgi:hypothetical protein
MENTIKIKSISSYNNDKRPLLYLEVNYNGTEYQWQTFGIPDTNLTETIESKKELIFAEIQFKLDKWETLEPKTKIIEEFDENTGDIVQLEVPLLKEEVVRPEVPDYYHLRSTVYPSIGEQLGALYKGTDSSDYIEMQQKIEQVKIDIPKPEWMN